MFSYDVPNLPDSSSIDTDYSRLAIGFCVRDIDFCAEAVELTLLDIEF